MEELSNVKAIRTYFEKVTMQELKDLSAEDRQELGDLIREELSHTEES